MKLKQRKENKYAFNLNSRQNKNRKAISFKALTGNFYDDLLNSDMRIKRNKKELSNIKNNTIKESIYCNKDIPKSWKTILGYTEEVYKAIDKDSNFAYYIGSSNRDNKINEFFGTQLKNINTNEKNKKFINIDNIDKYIKDNEKENELSENEKNIKRKESKTLTHYVEHKKEKHKLKNAFQWGIHDNYMNDKFISSKLDEYRSKYDINKYIGNIRSKIDNIKVKKDYINNEEIIKENKNNYKDFLKDKTQNNKENVLKKSIFSNLIPEKRRNQYYNSTFNNIKENNMPGINKTKRFTPFKTISFFRKENDSRKSSITNKIMRDLELINYYGPHYSNCNVCNKRNMEFYENSEPNQTLILLNYLKKIKLNRKKSNINKE